MNTRNHNFPPFMADPVDVPATEYAAHCIWSEVRALAIVPVAELALERDLLIEARELLNDQIDRAERHLERDAAPSLFERMH